MRKAWTARIWGMGLWCGCLLTAFAQEAAPRNPHPYRDVDWAQAEQVLTASHMHLDNQQKLDLFLARGFGFFTVSNYYPSAPYYPLAALRAGQFKVRQEHAVVKDGVLTAGPFAWNEIVAPWLAEVADEYRAAYPFTLGEPLFPAVPSDLAEAPNAEHHAFTDTGAHINAVGSFYASGTFDVRDRFRSRTHGYNYGTGLPWRQAFALMLEQLMVADGGGITINHPHWSSLPDAMVAAMLDYDPRVLGIEVYNESCGKIGKEWSEEVWDRMLASGRQCFGFFVPDHRTSQGVNILLVRTRTAAECLRAYRLGNWYGALKGSGLRFSRISWDGTTLRAACDRPARFAVIGRAGVLAERQGTELAYAPAAPPDALVYLRLKAYALDDSGEILFSQPFMLAPFRQSQPID